MMPTPCPTSTRGVSRLSGRPYQFQTSSCRRRRRATLHKLPNRASPCAGCATCLPTRTCTARRSARRRRGSGRGRSKDSQSVTLNGLSRSLRDRTPAPPPGYNRRLLFARGRPRRSHYRGERERCRTAFLLSFWNPTATTGIANVGIEAFQLHVFFFFK